MLGDRGKLLVAGMAGGVVTARAVALRGNEGSVMAVRLMSGVPTGCDADRRSLATLSDYAIWMT